MADRTRSNSTVATTATTATMAYRRSTSSSMSPQTSFAVVHSGPTPDSAEGTATSKTPSGYASSCPDLLFVKTEPCAVGETHRKLHLSASLSEGRHSPRADGYSRHQQPQSTKTSPCRGREGLSRKTSSVSSCRSSSEMSCDEELDISKVIPEIKIDELPQSSTPFRDKNISEILSFLFVGDAEAAFREPLLCRLNIECVVDLSNLSHDEISKSIRLKDCPCVCPSQMKHTRIRLTLQVDDTVNEEIIHYFDEINAFIEGARKVDRKCLVYCFAGRSLSPTIVIQYLMQHNGMTLKQAYSLVKKRRPETTISAGFRSALVRLERQLHPNTNPAIMFESEFQTEAVGLSCTQQAWT
ncbi:dual specificity protein phosphatase 1-like [Acanthaster planci]|uniref:protein-tyrosine-phosphatase n=1 Tax=Acanthaster planci TaxID=133434 RepID=A0A8B7ZYM2_ACAPL|nr:dual specificity protein phosphatase 1-like [Acanthaster planci]